VFVVNSGVTAAVSSLTIPGGVAGGVAADGGGIANTGTLTLTDVVVIQCMSIGSGNGSSASGGGIYNTGALTLTGCNILGNTASGGFTSKG
jgi:hypothetical protein